MIAGGEFDGFNSFAVDNRDEAVPFFGDLSEIGLHFGAVVVGDKIDGADEVEIGIADNGVYAEFEPVQRTVDSDNNVDG